jgi:hypothetical protein
MHALIATERPRSRSIDTAAGPLPPIKLQFDLLRAVIKAEFVVFLVLLLAVALLHFKLNSGETGELLCRADL